MPLPGDAIPLRLELSRGNTNKFVRALLFNDSGAPLPGNPSVNLTPITAGLYLDNSVLFPNNVKAVTAVYEVFNDAGYTQRSKVDSNAIDVFELTTTGPLIINTNGQVLTGKIDGGGDLVGSIEGQTDLKTEVEDGQDLSGIIEGSPNLKGTVEEDQDIKPTTGAGGTIDGKVDC